MDNPGQELRKIIRLDWVIYLIVAVIAVLVLAGLFGVEADHMIVGTLVTFVTGIVTGILTYLRLTARARDDGKKRKSPEGASDGKP